MMPIARAVIAFLTALPDRIAHTFTADPHPGVVAALSLVAVALCLNMVRQLRRPDDDVYPTTVPTEHYIQPRILHDAQVAMIAAVADGDKRCGIRSHRAPTRRSVLADQLGRGWTWWWAGQRTAVGWRRAQITAQARDWWAQTTPEQPWAPVAKALTAVPPAVPREPIAVVLANRVAS